MPPCPGVEISGAEHDFFRVEKMRYVLDLLLSVINLSVQTVEIVERLPKVRFEG